MMGKVIIGILLILAAILVMPFLLIWALNVLFSTGIEYNIQTLAAALVLGGILSSTVHKK